MNPKDKTSKTPLSNVLIRTSLSELTEKISLIKTERFIKEFTKVMIIKNREDIKLIFHYEKYKPRLHNITSWFHNVDSLYDIKYEDLYRGACEASSNVIECTGKSDWIERVFSDKMIKEEILEKKVEDTRVEVFKKVFPEQNGFQKIFQILAPSDIDKNFVIDKFQYRVQEFTNRAPDVPILDRFVYWPYNVVFDVDYQTRVLLGHENLLKIIDNLTNWGSLTMVLHYNCSYIAKVDDNCDIELSIDDRGIPKFIINFNTESTVYSIIKNNLKTLEKYKDNFLVQDTFQFGTGGLLIYNSVFSFLISPFEDRKKDLCRYIELKEQHDKEKEKEYIRIAEEKQKEYKQLRHGDFRIQENISHANQNAKDILRSPFKKRKEESLNRKRFNENKTEPAEPPLEKQIKLEDVVKPAWSEVQKKRESDDKHEMFKIFSRVKSVLRITWENFQMLYKEVNEFNRQFIETNTIEQFYTIKTDYEKFKKSGFPKVALNDYYSNYKNYIRDKDMINSTFEEYFRACHPHEFSRFVKFYNSLINRK